jgi:3-dehydroquinate synthase
LPTAWSNSSGPRPKREPVRTLTVALGERSYPIHVGDGLLRRAGNLLAPLAARRAIIVTNPVVAQHHADVLQTAFETAGIQTELIVIPDGEAHKDWATLYELHTRLLELKAERSTVLIALGGGVIGDVAGFAAATYQRGIPLVQVPTTLLAQVDSAVGGKTAVNHPLGKNMIGAFYQPLAVISDTAALATLPDREYRAGIAEIIKYGAIRDLALFEWLETNIDRLLSRDAEAVTHAVIESCRIKAEIVAADERETGERVLLNFGHTFGHAIEAATGYGTWLHGEAVAAGMILASRLSAVVARLPISAVERLRALVERAGLPTDAPSLGEEEWFELTARDKKTESGKIRYVLLEALGEATIHSAVPQSDLRGIFGR